MNNIWKVYLDMFKESSSSKQQLKYKKPIIVNEDSDDDWNDDNKLSNTDNDDWDDNDSSNTDNKLDNNDNEFEEDENEDEANLDENKTGDNLQNNLNKKDSKTALVFSADLAAEFGTTCNKFTNVAVKVVKARNVDKLTADELNNIIDKLKSLLDAAKQSI